MSRPDLAQQLVIEERRANVARLYLQGRTQWSIAREVGVDQAQISRDLAAMREEWKASRIADTETDRLNALARIEAT